MATRAPKGGCYGQNGEFYKGGQFLPTTDLPKGAPYEFSASKYSADEKATYWAKKNAETRAADAIMMTHVEQIKVIQKSAEAKFNYYNGYKAWNALDRAFHKGMTYAQLQEMTDSAKSWSKWTNALWEYIKG